MDQSLKIWDLKQSNYEDDPIIIYDHDDEIACADIRKHDSFLASMDINGTCYIRSIANLQDAETILYTITSIPKDVDDYARILMNNEMPNAEGELLVVINDQILVLDINGRQVDSLQIDLDKNEGKAELLSLQYVPVLDNKFLYKLVCNNFKS